MQLSLDLYHVVKKNKSHHFDFKNGLIQYKDMV